MIIIAILVGCALGYGLVSLGRLMWRNKLITLYVIGGLLAIGLIDQVLDVARHGTISQRTAGMTVTVLGTYDDVSRYDMGERRVRLRIVNHSPNRFRAFEVRCGDFTVYDTNGIGVQESVIRSYTYIDSSKAAGRCVMHAAEIA